MARKLSGLMVLTCLVLMAQAPDGLAATYSITDLGSVDNAYIWRHSYTSGTPWSAGTEFSAGYPDYLPNLNGWVWGIGYYDYDKKTFYPYTNSNPGIKNSDGSYTIVFDSTTANPNFFITLPDGKKIISLDTIITYIVTYNFGTGNTYAVVSGKIIGMGTNHADQTPFYFEAFLEETMGNHQNMGYLSSFTLQYPYSLASQTPIPGAVWLLGTGLLGLACAGWRRRSQ